MVAQVGARVCLKRSQVLIPFRPFSVEEREDQRRDSDERPGQGFCRLHEVEGRERGDAEDHQDPGAGKLDPEGDPLEQEQEGRGGDQESEAGDGGTQKQERIQERKVSDFFH